MTEAPEKDWRKLAEQVASEKDPKKLMELAEQLSRALDAADHKPAKETQPRLKVDSDFEAER